ncbi:MAG: hypothetical protein JSU73_00435 [candidate division WOR-3 bacterium]|nr:MAG: hypothetical protein JSU73_00435 [candidate division WOR-3 bacterium]
MSHGLLLLAVAAGVAGAAPRVSLSANLGAQAVLSLAYRRLHIPINVALDAGPKASVIIGLHPMVPVCSSAYRGGLGASCRYRRLLGQTASWRPWVEAGLWAHYQENLLEGKERKNYIDKLADPMAGLNGCAGYRFQRSGSWFMFQIFGGISVPLARIVDEEVRPFGLPFPWAGLELGVTL